MNSNMFGFVVFLLIIGGILSVLTSPEFWITVVVVGVLMIIAAYCGAYQPRKISKSLWRNKNKTKSYTTKSYGSNNSKIDKLKKEVKDLDNEYKFERGFDPDWDEEEHLADKYKDVDEEEYLRARKEELRQKNTAYDYYLAPDEREDDDENW